ncbi:peptidylprolyl isomerase [Acidisphaera sp. S103]|uniref:peptidylprolyl isomerase n=1 Tax=Acidisphaera sp. S103 TaxID=1747223 RepID=UPI00131B552A|nr:peptidylprolyl isomerase [Acidisphaera sp. S103]
MPTPRRGQRSGPLACGLAGALALLLAAPAAGFAAGTPAKPTVAAVPAKPAVAGAPAKGEQPLADASRIAAVVNGDVISDADIANRARLFAISAGMPISSDVIDRLRPQILRQLIDEKLRIQESQRRKIVIQDAQIAGAIKDIETRNNMQPGALRAKLASDGVSSRTLIDQIRAQLAWSQMLKDVVVDKIHVTPAEVAEQQKLAAQQVGQTEYRLGEIFIPVDNPDNTADAQRFAETVITELRAGASFPLVAAQFSQTQSALEGGEIGWQQINQIDPAVARIVTQMPVGAVSNAVRVPGGFSVVTLQGKRVIGQELATMLTLRQAFVAFTTPLTDPQNPTEQQRQALAKAHSIQATVKSCDDMEATAKTLNPPNHPVDPGDVAADGVNPPAFRQILETIPIGKPTEPLISRDGIAVIAVCTRDQKNIGEVTAKQIEERLVNERIDMLSRQTMRDLRRKATIDVHNHGV